MRIDDLSLPAEKIPSSKKLSGRGASNAAPAKQSRDQVDLSPMSKALAESPHVEKLHGEVEAGTYAMDSLDISRKIVDEHLL